MHDNQLNVSVQTVRKLVDEQFPDWSCELEHRRRDDPEARFSTFIGIRRQHFLLEFQRRIMGSHFLLKAME
ncbi:hypothetical protein H181DRAFT_04609 [Streptomyces sp. WMMB 714]|uniref:hypothetical protein n=1 Tax=Streptomyces sp. WMMB 714 TaxID=1286822 RepID=UPI0005F87B01|nr:hypothetical protein [Streptomyces sp. WMMB 714]SCK04821.1 hypothetical protein H181DRAFT_00001 [Streptomyces sp. WMMB 714]SCK50996.1 hypothetical protein H181DRAFT_04609 [Streptomyces sp. WMMB 714]